jgi:hypothetical protein
MEYRASSADTTRTLTWDEFHAMIRRGEVAPSALVRARAVTDDDWWTADNLCVFHRESPVKYPFGEHLATQLERARRKKEREARLYDALRPYFDACERPWMVEDCYGLTPLEVITTEPAVCGASRLTISAALAPEYIVTCALTSFGPEYIVTCAFTSRELEVEAVTGSMSARTALWLQWFRPELVPDLEYEPPANVPPLEIRRATMVLPLERAPRPFRSWEVLLELTRAAPACDNQAFDGASFVHELRGGDVRLRATWSNPRRDVDPPQCGLVAAYRELLTATALVKHRRVL